MKTSPFAHLIQSECPEGIYYADLFRINNKVWAIQGFGKSSAARIASGNLRENDLARDAVSLELTDDGLCARYDMGALDPQKLEDLHKRYKVDAIAYCLSPSQTLKLKKGLQNSLITVDRHTFSSLCATYPYSAILAELFYSPAEVTNFANPQRMREYFSAITAKVDHIHYYLIPHCTTIEQKANLYLSATLNEEIIYVAGIEVEEIPGIVVHRF